MQFPHLFMASVDDGSDVPISPMPGTFSNYGSPNGSGPDLDGMGQRSNDAHFEELRDILLPLARGFADFSNHVKTISEAVGDVTSRIIGVEHAVNALVAKMALLTALEQNVNTFTENASSPLHVCAKLKQMQLPSRGVPARQDLGTYLDIVAAPQPLGPSDPMAMGHPDDNGNTRRRLDTFTSPEDEQARSAVLLRLKPSSLFVFQWPCRVS